MDIFKLINISYALTASQSMNIPHLLISQNPLSTVDIHESKFQILSEYKINRDERPIIQTLLRLSEGVYEKLGCFQAKWEIESEGHHISSRVASEILMQTVREMHVHLRNLKLLSLHLIKQKNLLRIWPQNLNRN